MADQVKFKHYQEVLMQDQEVLQGRVLAILADQGTQVLHQVIRVQISTLFQVEEHCQVEEDQAAIHHQRQVWELSKEVARHTV